MRIAILDASPVTAWTISRLLPAGVDYEVLPSFDAAHRVLSGCPPDAMLIGLTASRLPWHQLLELCQAHCPEVPYLMYYSLHALPQDSPVPWDLAEAAVAPVEIGQMRSAVHDLVERAAAREQTL